MTDKSLRQAVIDELEWEPRINAAGIRVAAKNGVVTLTGRVGTYAEKSAAEKAAGRVIGTKAVVEELDVHYPFDPPSDTDIAHYARQALAWDVEVPKESVEVKVGRGWVTLLGIVDRYFQREAAEKDIRRLRGVRGVSNDIEIRPQVSASEVTTEIKAALSRNAQIDAEKINVTADGGKVTLTGKVDSLQVRRLAQQTAWSAPGVEWVDDELTVA